MKEDEMGGECSKLGKRKGAYRILVGKREGNGPFGRARRRWE
jgi:hypothetical protein